MQYILSAFYNRPIFQDYCTLGRGAINLEVFETFYMSDALKLSCHSASQNTEGINAVIIIGYSADRADDIPEC